jgi:hypothetical protein
VQTIKATQWKAPYLVPYYFSTGITSGVLMSWIFSMFGLRMRFCLATTVLGVIGIFIHTILSFSDINTCSTGLFNDDNVFRVSDGSKMDVILTVPDWRETLGKQTNVTEAMKLQAQTTSQIIADVDSRAAAMTYAGCIIMLMVVLFQVIFVVVWYSMVQYGTVWYGTVRYGTVSYGMENSRHIYMYIYIPVFPFMACFIGL